MQLIAIFLLTLVIPFLGNAQGSSNLPMLRSFQLKDQFNTNHSVIFPFTNLVIITVADRSGSDQIEAWVAPLVKKYHHQYPIIGIADVSAVPGFLRNMVQDRFVKARMHPVMLDWQGNVTRQFPFAKNVANIFVVAPSGEVKLHLRGKPDQKSLELLFASINATARESASGAESSKKNP